ncbi:MAG TPA: hypothetical protein VK273_02625 [Gaiellaceae bacterium]|nr:hypothetical protein [Gaiellaceae bacterium]
MSVFNRRNAFIGWLVITLAKPVAKQKARAAARKAGTRKGGAVAASIAAVGAVAAGLMFWRKRHSANTPADR